MDGYLTVGQPAAVAAVRAMTASYVPHAILLAGPPSVGKRSLALDLAAALLCTGATGDARPCRSCRGCRMVEHGNHPDLFRLDPSGPGGQIRIGRSQDPEPGTVRWLATRLALLPVEAGERVAIVRDAQRMNDDAQSALLKTLEEPPPATTLILCADDEERLLPTVRSRCARVRLGAVGPRDIEGLLAALDLADAPTAARLARLAAGRPGLAVAYASAPGAEAVRVEISRTLLDLLSAPRSERLAAAKGLIGRALTLAALLSPPPVAIAETPTRRGRGKAATALVPPATPSADAARGGSDPSPTDGAAGEAGPSLEEPVAGEPAGKVAASDRRRALAVLLEAWRDVARDLVLVQLGASPVVREPALLEELESAAVALEPDAAAEALARLARADELLEANVSPELVLDVLLIRWPHRRRAA